MKKTSKPFEPCGATYQGMHCEQDLNHHYKPGGRLKHSFKGSWWTDAGVLAEQQRQHKEWTKEDGL
jgi:hypothetical protein